MISLTDVIENEKSITKLYNINYLEFLVKPGVTLDVEDIRASKREIVTRRPGEKFFVYGEGIEFFTFTREARELCATKEHLDNVIVNAFYTENISLLLVGEIFKYINKPAVPTNIFNSRDKAKKWLNQEMKKRGVPDLIYF